MLKSPAEYDRDTTSAKFKGIFANSLPRYWMPCCKQRALVDDSRMAKKEVEKHNRSDKGRSAWDAFYDNTP
jgi:hypothetical protein